MLQIRFNGVHKDIFVSPYGCDKEVHLSILLKRAPIMEIIYFKRIYKLNVMFSDT